MDWTKVTLFEGWKIDRGENGFTLSASFYAKAIEDFPEFGDFVCGADGNINRVPQGFESYKVAEISITPLTAAGPFTCAVTAKAQINSFGGGRQKSLVGTGSFSLGTEVETCRKAYARKSRKGMFMYPTMKESVGYLIHYLALTATYYVKKRIDMGAFGSFFGVIPHYSFPRWLESVPGGYNRWRLDYETLDQMTDTDGRTIIYKVTRKLKGIPDEFIDRDGDRMMWNEELLGRREWDDISRDIVVPPTTGGSTDI